MKEQQAKLLFDTGAFSKALVTAVPMADGYLLQMARVGKNSSSEIVELQRGGVRTFKTIDAAVATARAIGFRRVEVEL